MSPEDRASNCQKSTGETREQLTDFRKPGFLAVSKLDWRHTGRLRKRNNLLTGEKGGKGKEPNHRTARKPGTLQYIKYSLGAMVPVHSQHPPRLNEELIDETVMNNNLGN
jgi:hypothetical protein